MFIASGELTPLSWGLISLAIVFSLQLLLCFKARRIGIKCIPVYFIILGFICCLLTYWGIFGTYSAGAISGNGLVAAIFAFILGIAAVGILIAWVVYWIVLCAKRRRNF
ncbi:MAG: hypothetical protein RR606_04210 [Oscillospiraceae bacterium]